MEFNSIVRGHHIYKETWNPFVGEELQCKIEHGNVHDIYAVAVIREDIVVGHLPRNISTPCHLFLRKGGIISCVINGARRYSADLIQGGLEVPCRLVFQGSPQDLHKMKKMLQDAPKGQMKELEVEEEQTKQFAKEQAPVQKQLEPDQQNTRKHCVSGEPNIQNTENSSYEEQQRQEQSVTEQPQQEFRKSRKENRHYGIHGQIPK